VNVDDLDNEREKRVRRMKKDALGENTEAENLSRISTARTGEIE